MISLYYSVKYKDIYVQGVLKKPFKDYWERLDVIFQNFFLNFKMSCISTSEKEISILKHIAKKLQSCQYFSIQG